MGPIQILISSALNDRSTLVRMSYQDIESGVACIYLSGRLDVRTVPHIERKFMSVTVTQRKAMIVDLSGVELMNSVGLGLLISAANALRLRGKPMILLNPTPKVERVVQLACVDQLLPIAYGLAGALRRIRTETQ